MGKIRYHARIETPREHSEESAEKTIVDTLQGRFGEELRIAADVRQVDVYTRREFAVEIEIYNMREELIEEAEKVIDGIADFTVKGATDISYFPAEGEEFSGPLANEQDGISAPVDPIADYYNRMCQEEDDDHGSGGVQALAA